MVTIKRGILGGFSGKVANIVGTSWKGIAVMKSLPLSVANPRTFAQVNQRNKMSEGVAFGQAMGLGLVRTLWNRWAVKMSGFNSFIKANMEAFRSSLPVDLSKLKISIGDYIGLNGAVLQLSASVSVIDINWQSLTDNKGFNDDDKVYLLVCSDASEVLYASATGVNVSIGTVSVDSLSLELGTLVTVFITIVKNDGTQVCDSVSKSVVVS